MKILCNKAPNKSQLWFQSSYFFPRFCTTDLRFAAFFFEGFFWLCDGFLLLLLQLNFFFGAGFRFVFTLLLFIGVCGAFFYRLKYGDFRTRLKTSFRKNLKYGGNGTNDIFTIDNTNVLKKTFTIFNVSELKILGRVLQSKINFLKRI